MYSAEKASTMSEGTRLVGSTNVDDYVFLGAHNCSSQALTTHIQNLSSYVCQGDKLEKAVLHEYERRAPVKEVFT